MLATCSPERDIDPNQLDFKKESQIYRGKRTGIKIPEFAPADPRNVKSVLASKAQIKVYESPLNLLSPLKGTKLLGEYMYILRPLIYGMLDISYCINSLIPALAILSLLHSEWTDMILWCDGQLV
jgi:peroxin-16